MRHMMPSYCRTLQLRVKTTFVVVTRDNCIKYRVFSIQRWWLERRKLEVLSGVSCTAPWNWYSLQAISWRQEGTPGGIPWYAGAGSDKSKACILFISYSIFHDVFRMFLTKEKQGSVLGGTIYLFWNIWRYLIQASQITLVFSPRLSSDYFTYSRC